ncbi:alpha/beta hydrolase [Pareuzebyella sediminis]|uniref:alpha/beta hydrolase n=1 Tax=Pareuzebyella sediminis TaxID=2607998 RepID=UPI0011EFD72E|nr:alpha/beta hydrolase [Pareuzebyella sediminis]
MKRIFTVLAVGIALSVSGQQMTLKKGLIIDSLPVNDSISETFSLYLPTNFEVSKVWPVLFVFDMQGRGKQALSMFAKAAEEQGYVLASSNNLQDSVPLSKNLLVTSRMFDAVFSLIPIHKKRIYTGGFSHGGRFSTLVPTFVNSIAGVLACGATLGNIDVLSSRNPFHFVGIVGNSDYNYPQVLVAKKVLDRMKFPNEVLIFEGGQTWPPPVDISNALEVFTLEAMARGHIPKDSMFVQNKYQKDLAYVNELYTNNMPLLADNLLGEMLEIYRPFKDTDSIKDSRKTLRKSRLFKTRSREQNALFFKEELIKEDYEYYLEEDVITYNYNNLGWWNYQMEELQKFQKSPNILQQQMGRRLEGYIKALVADNIDAIKATAPQDTEALNFLWMLNTIIDPQAYENYLKIISYNAKIDDYGTALFYLEELLKNGYADRLKLYNLEDTALLRITPEFNEIVEKYLEKARYDIIEE